MANTRLVIADDLQMLREGLGRIISDYASDIEVVGLVANGEEAVRLASELHPDVILMDIRMPQMNGIEATKAIVDLGLQTKVVAMTTFDDDDYLVDVLLAGAVAYLLKVVPVEELIRVVRQVAAGESGISTELALRLAKQANERKPAPLRITASDRIADTDTLLALSEREREILDLLAEGMDNAEIAKTLSLSVGTVKNHVSHVYDKLGARDRTHAIILARRAGLIS